MSIDAGLLSVIAVAEQTIDLLFLLRNQRMDAGQCSHVGAINNALDGIAASIKREREPLMSSEESAKEAVEFEAWADREQANHSVIGQIKKKRVEKYNMWFEDDQMKVYVRKTHRLLLGGYREPTLEIGAIEVREELRRTGVFKRFLPQFEDLAYAEGRVVYIENVMDDWLKKYLGDYGFIGVNGTECFYKKA